MKNEIENIIDRELMEDAQGGYCYLALSNFVTVSPNKKLELYMYCRENGIQPYLDYQNKTKCFRKKREVE